MINRSNIFGYPGPKGDSAYRVAVKNGYIGSESDWLATLVGAQGPTGATGPLGSPMSVWVGTQVAYEALGAWDDDTIYFVI